MFGVLALPLSMFSAPVALPDPMPAHPRLFADAARFSSLREQVKNDPISARIFTDLTRRADKMLTLPALTYKKEGRRLLSVSRDALERISTLAMVARLTDDPRYSERAIAEMRAVTTFSDWNPSHYLDTAEMSLAVAIGYDWLFECINPADRARFAQALLDLGLSQAETGPASQRGWITGTNNWNQVCHAGMVCAAIALADEQPAIALRTLNRAVENLHRSADHYAPDGAYPEGPMYWNYGTTFHVMLTDALAHFLGDAHGTDDYPGFLASADYVMQMVTPTGRLYSYADCVTGSAGADIPLYWFARKTRRADLLLANNTMVTGAKPEALLKTEPSRVEALALIWIDTSLATTDKHPPLSWYGRGENPVSVHRSAWDDKRATFIGLKGGAANVSHGHMDSGSFLLEADGVRWAVDLGMQDYNSLESKGIVLWSNKQDSPRWGVFRVGAESHNILRFDGAVPDVTGRGELVKFSAQLASSVVTLDKVYAGQVASVHRGVALQPDRCVLIQDEWTAGAKSVEVTWQFLTEAKTATVGKGEITLEQAGQRLVLRVLTPADAQLAVEDVSAPRADYDAANPNLKRITLRTRTAAGATGGFRVLAVPGSVTSPVVPPLTSLADWAGAGF
jgi:oligo-alginate lyase